MKKSIQIYGYSGTGAANRAFGIETDVRSGFPDFEIIGLADSAIKESRERVKTALRNCGFKFPQQHVLVSLSPADLPKSGSLLDLGICLGILFATSKDKDTTSETVMVMTAGELSLDGTVVADNSALSAVDLSHKLGCQICLIPLESEDPTVVTVKNLTQAFIKCGELLNSDLPVVKPEVRPKPVHSIFSDVVGLEKEKTAVAIAAAGFHSILFFGPPGVGKSLLSSRIRYLLPQPSPEESRTVLAIHAQDDDPRLVLEDGVSCVVPHDCNVSLFNSGSGARFRGYATQAHRGTLILDELNKYAPSLLETVKNAYDCGYTVSSKNGEATANPSRFMLVANMNACACCGLGSRFTPCTCTSLKLENHWRRVGRAILDRFDVRLPIPEVDFADVSQPEHDDAWYQNKVGCAVERQRFRYRDAGIACNGELRLAASPLSYLSKELSLLNSMKFDVNENIRGRIELLSLARTIADFDDRDAVEEADILQALGMHKYVTNGDYYWRVLNV